MHPVDIGKPKPEWIGWSKKDVLECFEEQKSEPQPAPLQPTEQVPKVIVVAQEPVVQSSRMPRRKIILFILLILVSLLLGFLIYQSRNKL